MSSTHLTRRFILGATGAALAAGPARARTEGIVNPIIERRADGQILRDGGWYYFMGTVPEYDRLVLRRSRTLAGLSKASEVTLWTRPSKGRMGGYIWAPELHRFDGQWRVYFGAGDHGDVFHVRTYVLASKDRDPMTANWRVLGEVETPWDTFNLDATVFEHRGVRYLVWAQHEPGIDTNSNLYIAPLATATTLAAKPVRLSIPELAWETIGYKVNEGPAALVRNGRVFITYSASATDEHYCLGMLTANENADLMDPSSWIKSQEPVFKTCPEHNIWGPGHNGFTVDEKGRDMLLFHARDYQEITGDPLHDPNRSERLQYIRYRSDGTPDFGLPVANGPLKT
jgi:GH43 family beta-xylosidase